MYVSVETPEATDRRLRQVIKEAELEWLAGRFAFVEYPCSAFPKQVISEALAFVRDDEVWSVLRPAPPGGGGEIVAVFRVHFRPDADNSGFVGWLATLIKRRLGTGVFVVCGQNGRRGGIFDYWGVPIAQRENAEALLAELQLLTDDQRGDTPMEFVDALLALQPHPDLASDPFKPLIGSWDLTVTWYDKLGRVDRVLTGEWHFERILEGRAVQDVWIVPRRSDRSPDTSGEYGTSVRYAQPGGTWRSLWIGPYHDFVRHFVARAVEGGIVLESDAGTQPALRWVFSNITHDRFDWHNYEIGETERLIQGFEAVRQSGA